MELDNVPLNTSSSKPPSPHDVGKLRNLKLCVIIFYLFVVALNAYHTYRVSYVNHWTDFSTFLASANALCNGANPYVTGSHW